MAAEHVVPVNGAEKEPFIPYVQEKDYPPHLMRLLEPYNKRMGFLCNCNKLYMHRPEIAAPIWTLNSAVMRDPSSTLPQSIKRRCGAIASRVNECTYCATHHAGLMTNKNATKSGVNGLDGTGPEGWSMGHQDLIDLMEGDIEPADEVERVCFDFTRAASLDPAGVPDEIYERLKKHLTPPQIVELACVVGFWKMYNTIHDALRIPIEAHLEKDTKYISQLIGA